MIAIDPEEWQVMLRLPPQGALALAASPDGTLFLAGAHGLYRYSASDSKCAANGADCAWVRIADSPARIVNLYAPAAEHVFARGGVNGLYAWRGETAGWETFWTPLSDSVTVHGHAVRPIPLLSLWGRSETDVYAVGMDGAILHYDGSMWALETNPLVPSGAPEPEEPALDDLYAVGGDEHHVYAAGGEFLRKRAGKWERIPVREETGAVGTIRAVVSASGDLLIGGGWGRGFLLRLHKGDWIPSNELLRRFRGPIVEGAIQPDGSALIWNYTGAVLEFREGSRLYRFPELGYIGGAAAVGRYLYLAGRYGKEDLVVRVRRF